MMTMTDPRRIEIVRHLLEARRLARALDTQILDFLLEQAMIEAMGHDAKAMAEAIGWLRDPQSEP
jgi:hypothetical protein